jgi:clathrin heavy chain
MHPTTTILALKSGDQLQVFNVAQKAKVAETTVKSPVVYWKWVSDDVLALVTATEVYHWTVSGSGAGKPVKVFDRHDDLAACQIINYRADPSLTWLCLVGIAQENGRIAGHMQLYSVERKVSQPIEGHACAFASFTTDGAKAPSTMFAFAVRNATGAKVYLLEVSKGEGSTFEKKSTDLVFPPDAASDFPIGLQISEKHGIVYVLTKLGYLHLFDLGSGSLIYRNRISTETIFITAPHRERGGILAVNRKGQVLLITVDEQNIVPFIVNTVQNVPLAIKLASRCNLPGADQLFVQQFRRLFEAGQHAAAAKVAAESPGGALRNADTIRLFQNLPPNPSGPSPLLQYFGALLERGKLNEVESLELVRPVVAQGRQQMVEKWLKEEKLTCTEDLGDVVKAADATLALSVYYRAQAHPKVILCLAETRQYDKIVAYANKTGYRPDYASILSAILAVDAAAATSFAQMLLSNESGPLVDPNAVMDAFMKKALVKECTTVLLEFLKGNRADQGPLQTRLLEINLQHAPQVADAVLGNEMFTHYNRQRVAQLAEKAGLTQRALEHYSDPKDIRRCLTKAGAGSGVSAEFLSNYFGTLSVDDTLDILRDMLRANARQNMETVVSIAAKYSEQLTPKALIKLFEDFKAYEGVYFYLGQIVNESEDPEVHFKYLEAAARTRNFKEVERIARDSNSIEAGRAKDFLMANKLPDQLPLIIICDRFGFVDELTRFLYKNNMSRYIEAYVQQINPANAASVVGGLIDVNCDETYIKKLILSIRGMVPVEALVEECGKRNRLKLILPWLEARVAEGNQEPATHNALAKIYIDLNKNSEEFLRENEYYEPAVVGAYCEKRDPYLAFVAYKKGGCDDELIAITNSAALFKNQARYLVERQDMELWAKVLTEENEFRRSVIDQVVQTALPETKNPEEVSNTVKAFMAADLPTELMSLLEKIVLDPSADPEFSQNRNLQNLIILTAIKADKGRVMDYVKRLDNYDAPEIAEIAVGASLFEEAFTIYKKAGEMNKEAVTVLVDHIKDLERAQEYADKADENEVYSIVAAAWLEGGDVKKAMLAYIAAEDPSAFMQVSGAADDAEAHDELIDYLLMCRPKVSEPFVDSELAYSYAKTGRVAELEEFVSNPNIARLEDVGDRCFDQGMFKAAKYIFAAIDSYARLASCLIRLEDYSGAADAAKKAGSVKTWKEVCMACVVAKEFDIAQSCGLHVVTHGDELEDLVFHYERCGAFDEAITLLEKAVAAGTKDAPAHKGIYTELAVLYSRHRESKLMDFVRAHSGKVHLQKVQRAAEQNMQWAELAHLYSAGGEFDSAALTMIGHPTVAHSHNAFKEVIVKVNNADLHYKAVQFYVEEKPTELNDLLSTLTPLVDHSRVVSLLRKLNHLALAKPYLSAVQDTNTAAVNEAFNELLVEEEDFEALRKSVTTYLAFDYVALAKQLEKHQLLELRRIAGELYARNKRYEQAIDLAKKDKLYKDAMRVASESKSAELAESLLKYLIADVKSPECFAACLYTCYDLLRPDVAMELAWRHKCTDYAMPYLIQSLREYQTKVDRLEAHCFPPPKKTDEEGGESFEAGSQFGLGQTLAITYGGPQAGMGPVDPNTGMPYGQPGMPPQMGYMGPPGGGF